MARFRRGDHRRGRERLCLSQQMPQGVVHRRFTVTGGMLQNSQVVARGRARRVFPPQPVIGHPKAAVGEQILAIAVVLEGARLSHQVIDDVPITDRVLVATHQPRQGVDLLARVPQLHAVGIQPGFDFLADQAAVNRVGVAVQVDQAPLVHAHRQPQARIQPLRRKRRQRRQFLGMPLSPAGVARGDHLFEKLHVFFAAVEVPTATQVQGLVHGRLEVPVRGFTVAILVRLADVDPLARQTVMLQQPLITCSKLALGRQVVDRRAQAVAAMPSRRSAQVPQRILKAVGQGLERLRRADAHRLPIRVGEHEVIRQMLESFSQDGDFQRVHVGEIGGRQVAGVMHLAEHDRAAQTGRRPPLPNAPLERAALARCEVLGVFFPQPVEQRLGPQAGLRFEPCLDFQPQFRERVLPRSIGPWLLEGARQGAPRAILACRLFVHSSPPGGNRQKIP